MQNKITMKQNKSFRQANIKKIENTNVGKDTEQLSYFADGRVNYCNHLGKFWCFLIKTKCMPTL